MWRGAKVVMKRRLWIVVLNESVLGHKFQCGEVVVHLVFPEIVDGKFV